MLRVGVIGDFGPRAVTHVATNQALRHAADALGEELHVQWVATDTIAGAEDLHGFSAFTIAPGSPYHSQQGALAAIRFARTAGVPLLGTCGGFQHVVLAHARNVLGLEDAEHGEYNPYASRLFITPLSCSLAGEVMDVEIKRNTAASWAYQAARASERYYCSFGLNPEYLDTIVRGGLTLSGVDSGGEPRILELTSSHPFFLATLFIPQTLSTAEHPHPLLSALLRVAREP